ncbi:MAG: CPBP family intramembrane glutamic endopeptidase [Candidatus Obscuribacterales bacterium]|jgi:membrane protease YdiL (CAAX protease family)
MSHPNKYVKTVWNALVHPTVRLSADFPFSPGRSLKLYATSIVFFTIGSALPLCLFLLALRFMPTDNSVIGKLLMAPGAEGMILTVISLATFICGFGLQLSWVVRAFHKDGLKLRDVISCNLKSLNGSWPKAIGLGVLTFAVGLAAEQLMGLVYTLPSTDPTANFMKTLGGGALYLMAALAMIGPVMEEIIFRGFLFNVLNSSVTKKLGSGTLTTMVAVVGSAFVFGAMHMNLPALPFYMVLGAVYAEAYRRSGTLVVPIVAHVLNNSMIVIALILSH